MAITKDAVRIDWRRALDECDQSLTNSCINNTDTEYLWDKAMKIADLNVKIKEMYRKDCILGYLELLDENRDILKPGTLWRLSV